MQKYESFRTFVAFLLNNYKMSAKVSNDRGTFGSRLGVVLASAGSAVGLGNIWRFPTEVGNNGGAAFIMVYLAFVFLLAMPVMLAEFVIGRGSKANTVGAYRTLAPGKPWIVAGFMGVICGILVLSFYSVVAGWTLHYTVESFANRLTAGQDFKAVFDNFVTNPWKPIAFQMAFLLMTHFVVSRGVERGIERYSKIMMPVLLLIIVVLVCCSLTMPGAGEGLQFLLHPDFSRVTTSVVLSAMGQAFFSLSVGLGCLATYASYFKKDTPLVSSAFNVCVLDSLVAILSGFIIFPAVFSVPGMAPNAGPGLVYITLPHVFNEAFSAMPLLGYLFSGMFYVLLHHLDARDSHGLHPRELSPFAAQGCRRGHAHLHAAGSGLLVVVWPVERDKDMESRFLRPFRFPHCQVPHAFGRHPHHDVRGVVSRSPLRGGPAHQRRCPEGARFACVALPHPLGGADRSGHSIP